MIAPPRVALSPALRRRQVGAALLSAGAGLGPAWSAPRAEGPEGRRVRVVGSTDSRAVQPLIDDFERRHDWRVDYLELGSVELYAHALRAASPGSAPAERADVLWSSAMDLQIKLVNDGLALRYASPHREQLPAWASWKAEAYCTTYEPMALVYHRQHLSEAELPDTHDALTALLRRDSARLRGRVACYDIERAGLGYLTAAHDQMALPSYWALVQALGGCEVRLFPRAQPMLDALAAGDTWLALNVLGPYAEALARQRPEAVGIRYLRDYTLVVSRVAFIAGNAPNPAGAQAWLDHLLSPAGQALLASSGLNPVRADLPPLPGQTPWPERLGAAARPIALGPGLLAHLDQSKRAAFIRRWRQALAKSG